MPSATINVVGGERVKGLMYDNSVTGGQSATFNFTVSLPSGYSATTVNWWVDPQVGDPPTTGSTFSYKAVGVGKHTITVKVGTNKGVLNGSTSVVAIGGPLFYVTVPGTQPLSAFNACDSVPEHDDNDVAKPFHMQYFGYTSDPPLLLQKPQTGQVIAGCQPLGTTVTFTVEGPAILTNTTYSIPTYPFIGFLECKAVNVTPNDGSQIGGIKIRAKYTYEDSSLSGPATPVNDDSVQTPPPGMSVTCAEYYSFTSHKPTSIEVAFTASTDSQGKSLSKVLDNGNWISERYDWMGLIDQNGQYQPGVWVQERYEDLAPLNSWRTKYGQPFTPEGFNDNYSNWTTCKLASNYGIFHLTEPYADHLRLMFYPRSNDTLGQVDHLILKHKYIAATYDTTAGGCGIDLGTWKMDYNPGLSVTHTKDNP